MYPAHTQLLAKWSSPSIGDRRATGCNAWWHMYITKISHFWERWHFLHVIHEKWAVIASVCLFFTFHPHFPLYHQDEIWKMRSNDYHWAEINHPMPANISEEDLDYTTKEREGVFGGGCIFGKKTSWGSIWRTKSWRRSPGFADIIKGNTKSLTNLKRRRIFDSSIILPPRKARTDAERMQAVRTFLLSLLFLFRPDGSSNWGLFVNRPPKLYPSPTIQSRSADYRAKYGLVIMRMIIVMIRAIGNIDAIRHWVKWVDKKGYKESVSCWKRKPLCSGRFQPVWAYPGARGWLFPPSACLEEHY